jgi:hypothetical protein
MEETARRMVQLTFADGRANGKNSDDSTHLASLHDTLVPSWIRRVNRDQEHVPPLRLQIVPIGVLIVVPVIVTVYSGPTRRQIGDPKKW